MTTSSCPPVILRYIYRLKGPRTVCEATHLRAFLDILQTYFSIAVTSISSVTS